MKNLLYNELRLAFHPTVALFWLLSAMLLIPSYPYYVILFYSMLGIFFVCLTGRENHDLYFTMSLPIRKRDLVRARFGFVVMIELIQLLIAVPFAILRQRLPLPGNEVGMDANIAFFGISLLLFGLYNWIFLTAYYAAPDKVGKTFAITSVVMWGSDHCRGGALPYRALHARPAGYARPALHYREACGAGGWVFMLYSAYLARPSQVGEGF